MSWYEFDDFSFEIEARILKRNGRAVRLTPKAGELLLLFLESSGKLITKEEIKRRVWPGTEYVGPNNLLFQMNAVRVALGRRMNGEVYIETLPKRGYRFVVSVEKCCLGEAEIATSQLPNQEPPQAEPRLAATDAFAADQTKPLRSPARQSALYVIIGAVLLIELGAPFASLLSPARQLRVVRYDPLTRDTRGNLGGQLVTDGTRVYFKIEGPNGSVLAYVAVAGGVTGIAFPINSKTIQDLSPVSSEFLATQAAWHQDGGELWVIPMAGEPRRLIGDVRASSAYWSPDKRQIAFTVKSELYIADATGAVRRKVA